MTFTYFSDRRIRPLRDNKSSVLYYMLIICECMLESKRDANTIRIISVGDMTAKMDYKHILFTVHILC